MTDATPLTIRRLCPADVPLMQAMTRMFAEAFDEPETYVGQPPGRGYLERLLYREGFIALVAVKGGVVVGGLVAYELEKFERERREIYIYDLAVAEPHRRRGIATGLIGELRRIGAERGAWVIFVQADYGDDPAIALYEKLGDREEVLHFDIPVRLSPRPPR